VTVSVAARAIPTFVSFDAGCGASAHVDIVTSGTRFGALPTAYIDVRGDRVGQCACGARLAFRGDLEDHKPYRGDVDALDEDGDERREDAADLNYDGGRDPDYQRSYL
jgi:hypothetical protein